MFQQTFTVEISPFTFLRWNSAQRTLEVVAPQICHTPVILLTIDGVGIDELVSFAVSQNGNNAMTEHFAAWFPYYVTGATSLRAFNCFVVTGRAQATIMRPYTSPPAIEVWNLTADAEKYACAVMFDEQRRLGSSMRPLVMSAASPRVGQAPVSSSATTPTSRGSVPAGAAAALVPTQQSFPQALAPPTSFAPSPRAPRAGGAGSASGAALSLSLPFVPAMPAATPHMTTATAAAAATSAPSPMSLSESVARLPPFRRLAPPPPQPPLPPPPPPAVPMPPANVKEERRRLRAQHARPPGIAVTEPDAAKKLPEYEAAFNISPFTFLKFDARLQRVMVYSPEVADLHSYLMSIDGVSAEEIVALALREEDEGPGQGEKLRTLAADFPRHVFAVAETKGGSCFVTTRCATVTVEKVRDERRVRTFWAQSDEKRYAEARRQEQLLNAPPPSSPATTPEEASSGLPVSGAAAAASLPFSYVSYEPERRALWVQVREIAEAPIELLAFNLIDVKDIVTHAFAVCGQNALSEAWVAQLPSFLAALTPRARPFNFEPRGWAIVEVRHAATRTTEVFFVPSTPARLALALRCEEVEQRELTDAYASISLEQYFTEPVANLLALERPVSPTAGEERSTQAPPPSSPSRGASSSPAALSPFALLAAAGGRLVTISPFTDIWYDRGADKIHAKAPGLGDKLRDEFVTIHSIDSILTSEFIDYIFNKYGADVLGWRFPLLFPTFLDEYAKERRMITFPSTKRANIVFIPPTKTNRSKSTPVLAREDYYRRTLWHGARREAREAVQRRVVQMAISAWPYPSPRSTPSPTAAAESTGAAAADVAGPREATDDVLPLGANAPATAAAAAAETGATTSADHTLWEQRSTTSPSTSSHLASSLASPFSQAARSPSPSSPASPGAAKRSAVLVVRGSMLKAMAAATDTGLSFAEIRLAYEAALVRSFHIPTNVIELFEAIGRNATLRAMLES